jgi:predicted enzyme related to lactoylglutathione lyase
MALYIDVEDLADYRNKVVEAGGKVVVEEMEAPEVGRFSLLADPDGRILGLWKQLPSGP